MHRGRRFDQEEVVGESGGGVGRFDMVSSTQNRPCGILILYLIRLAPCPLFIQDMYGYGQSTGAGL